MMSHAILQAAAMFLGLSVSSRIQRSLHWPWPLQDAIDLRQDPRSLPRLFCLLIIVPLPIRHRV